MTTSAEYVNDVSPISDQSATAKEVATGVPTLRYHYLDNLRALAMFAGVVFHAAVAYSALLSEAWPTADTRASQYIDMFIWAIHTFRMPLFFLIAGFFACLLIEKRGATGYLKNRALRIALPFIIFWPMSFAGIFGIMIYAAMHTEMNTPIINLIRHIIENPDAAGEPPEPTTTHLWFLYYLMIFSLASFIFSRIYSLKPRFVKALSHPLVLLAVLPALTGMSLLKTYLPHPAAESFIPEFWALGFYGLFFFMGWIFFRNKSLVDPLKRYVVPLLFISILVYSLFFYLMPKTFPLDEVIALKGTYPELTLTQVALAMCTGILAWYISYLCLIGAQKFLHWQSDFLRLISDSSYWIYIIHVPMLFFIQFKLHFLEWPILVELAISIVLTFGIGFISYIALVRYTPIGWMLNGRKSHKAIMQTS